MSNSDRLCIICGKVQDKSEMVRKVSQRQPLKDWTAYDYFCPECDRDNIGGL